MNNTGPWTSPPDPFSSQPDPFSPQPPAPSGGARGSGFGGNPAPQTWSTGPNTTQQPWGTRPPQGPGPGPSWPTGAQQTPHWDPGQTQSYGTGAIPTWTGPWDAPGQPPPPPGAPPPYGYQQPDAPKRSRRLVWILPLLLVIVIGGGAGGYWAYTRHQAEQQRDQIRNTINAFAEASDTADTKKLASLMCKAEADQFTDGFEGQGDDGPITPAERAPVNIGTINVTDDNDATVDVTRPPKPAVTMKLKREDGTWKLCNPS